MSNGLSITAYARHRGVSHVAVLKAIKAGRIEKEPDGTIDPEKADAAWTRNTNQAQQRKAAKPSEQQRNHTDAEAHVGPPIVNSGPSFAQSRAIKEAYNARLAKLAYEEKSGALVRADSIKVSWFNVLRVLRDRTLNLPDRLAPMLAAETDPKTVRDMLDEELRKILDDASDAITNLPNG
ncbi:MAG: hypothetical protein AB7H77_10990 [Bdellovibrionales bacterium]